MLTLALAGCPHGERATPQASDPLPEAGRAIRLTTEDGAFVGEQAFDVVEVVGDRVRLRKPLCEIDDPGVWVDWGTVQSWNDAGTAVGDNRYLGLPIEDY